MNIRNRAGGRDTDLRQIRGKIDSDDPFFPGHGIKTGGSQGSRHARRIQSTPAWTKSDTKIRALLLKVFPKLGSDERQRERAARWTRVIYLYFRAGMTYSQIAEDMCISRNAAHELIKGIQRSSRGLDARGRERLRRRGRPKKIVTQ